MKFKDLNVVNTPIKHTISLIKFNVPGKLILLSIKINSITVNTGMVEAKFEM